MKFTPKTQEEIEHIISTLEPGTNILVVERFDYASTKSFAYMVQFGQFIGVSEGEGSPTSWRALQVADAWWPDGRVEDWSPILIPGIVDIFVLNNAADLARLDGMN